jgi:hypothetical protein
MNNVYAIHILDHPWRNRAEARQPRGLHERRRSSLMR